MGRDALRTLTEVRAGKVDLASSAVARAVAARDAAAQARSRAEAERDGHASGVARALEAERAALDSGALRAADLAVEAAWRQRAARDGDALAAGVRRAGEHEAGAGRDEQAARAALAACKADADAASALQSRRETARRKRAEVRAEDAAAETWRPRR